MPRETWPLLHQMPRVQVEICLRDGTVFAVRDLLADTGAGAANSVFDLILHEDDCCYCQGRYLLDVKLEGALTGTFELYSVRVKIRAIGFDDFVCVVAAPQGPPGFDGIACFPFVNRFGYGNFGVPNQFGLES